MTDEPVAKKILYVITKANWGGAQRYVFDLAQASREAGHEVAVAYGEEGALLSKLDGLSIPHQKIEGLGKRLNLKAELKAFKELVDLLRSSKPDVIHVNSSKGGLAVLAARIAGVPRIIFTAHGWAFNEKRSSLQKLLMRLAYAATIYLSHLTICVSESIRRDISWLPLAAFRCTVIRHGIDPVTLMSKGEARKALAPSLKPKVWLGMIAEFHPTKRVEDAIVSLAELKDEYPDLGLVVIGDGEYRDYLESLIAHYGLEDRVVFPGFIENAAAYLSAFDIFLMPSRTEALGYALLEAAQASLPSIGSRVGGIPEIIMHKRTGLLVPPENPAALSRAIRTLLQDDELRTEVATRLHDHVQTNFSKRLMVAQTLLRY